MIVFGSVLFTNDVVNLKLQGAGQKQMIGWHKHQGVSETLKNADVICEQPPKLSHPHVKNGGNYLNIFIIYPLIFLFS